MDAEITIHAGCAGDRFTIHVDWFDHNNVHQWDEVEIRIKDQDKPRILQVIVNRESVFEKNAQTNK